MEIGSENCTQPVTKHHLPPLKTVGLFAGIGGFEFGLGQVGHQTAALCEIWDPAVAVLAARFPGVKIIRDVCQVEQPGHDSPEYLPPDLGLLTAGFPCTDLSQAGQTSGITGRNSGLVSQVFRILRHRAEQGRPIPWLIIENVRNMLHLAGGEAMRVITSSLEELGYDWAYRLVDSQAFGVPQRRERVFLVASLVGDPREIVFADEAREPGIPAKEAWELGVGVGFYWTEGMRGLGWAHEAVPTLKGGSTLGIPSSPAIVLPSGLVIQPDIRDAERMQGFPSGWTDPALGTSRPGYRWKLVGNAVTVDVARWLGFRLRNPGRYDSSEDRKFDRTGSWPAAAWSVGGHMGAATVSAWPVQVPRPPLAQFLDYPGAPLSYRAISGFLNRLTSPQSKLRVPQHFIGTLKDHQRRMDPKRSEKSYVKNHQLGLPLAPSTN